MPVLNTAEGVQRVTGNDLILRAFLDAEGLVLTNVQLGQVRGVQAFRSRISDLRRRGFIIREGQKVGNGRYAYALVGVHAGSDAVGHPDLADRPLDVLEGDAMQRAMDNAAQYIDEHRDRLAKAGDAPRVAMVPSHAEALANARERGDRWESLFHEVIDEQREALGLDAGTSPMEVRAAVLERLRAPAPRRRAAREGTVSGPDLMRAVLEEANVPLHAKVIAERVLARPDNPYGGKTPDATMGAQLATAHKRGGQFERVAPSVYVLRHWTAEQKGATPVMPT